MARPRGKPPNHHLKLENGVWIFRWTRRGEDERKSTGYPKSEIAAARRVRDKWIGERQDKRHGTELLPAVGTLEEVVRLYLEAESRPYDREKGGEQPGTKRGASGDRVIVARLRKHLDFLLPADRIDAERLLDAAAGMSAAGRVVQTNAGPKRVGDLAGLTLRNTFRFLRRVYAWARVNPRKTGVVASPFDALQTSERKRLFPSKVAKKAPPFTRDELRALLELLPAHAARPVRFAAHSGMRWTSELLRMTWDRVDLDRRVYTVDPRYAKRGKEREVSLGDVAVEILRQIRPAAVAAGDSVWLGPEGEALREVRRSYRKAVRAVCADPGPGKRRPDFHSLRRTCATALERVGAPRAVVAKSLGHSEEGDVTSLYITATTEDCVRWLNRAAFAIDGSVTDNVVALPRPVRETAVKTAVGFGWREEG